MSDELVITDEHREFAANILHNLPFAKLIGMRLVDMQPGMAVIEIEMRDELRIPVAFCTAVSPQR